MISQSARLSIGVPLDSQVSLSGSGLRGWLRDECLEAVLHVGPPRGVVNAVRLRLIFELDAVRLQVVT